MNVQSYNMHSIPHVIQQPSVLSPLGLKTPADSSPLGARTTGTHPPHQPAAAMAIPETGSLVEVSRNWAFGREGVEVYSHDARF